MFVGREQELASLEEFYAKDGIGMTVIYGRRRIGKSTLITEFVKDKKTVFYTATKIGKARNLELFSKQVLDLFMPGIENISFNSIEAVFDFIDKNIANDKIVLVIDELPYWAEKDDSLLSILQKYIDTIWNDKNLKIILCGSALSFMENKVLSEKSPLFGRRDSQIKLESFNYLDSAKFVPNYSNEDKAICYGITGGVAKYLSMIDPKKNIDENIIRLFFRTDGYLYDETRNLLTQEFSDISLVNNIVEQIASGVNTLNTISGKINEKEPTVLYSLEKLISVGLIEKKKCITEEKNKKKTQIVLTIGYDIENITDKNGYIRAQSADIDIVALSDIDKKAVIGECKFKNEKIDKGIYETLVRRGTLISNKYKISKYIFFSLSGYTDWFNSLSDEDVLLLTLDSLYR